VGLIERSAGTTDEVLRAIAEPNRRAILQLVAREEMAAGDIATHFSVTRPAISQHLAVLLAAGLVSERRVGTKRLFQARPEGLDDLRVFLAEMWPMALGSFKAAAEAGASWGGGAGPTNRAHRRINEGSVTAPLHGGLRRWEPRRRRWPGLRRRPADVWLSPKFGSIVLSRAVSLNRGSCLTLLQQMGLVPSPAATE
jgi:DNA-binding transcriptional ArsR family regulator